MFGKPQWFRAGSRGTVRPRTFLGWLHTFAWIAALGVPASILVAVHHVPEAAIWIAAMALAWRWDLRTVRVAHRPANKKVKELFVIDEETDITRVTTDKFDLTAQRG